jgi:tRNA-splicing ligase RtcB
VTAGAPPSPSPSHEPEPLQADAARAPEAAAFRRIGPAQWELPASGAMRVPVRVFADATLLRDLDAQALQQAVRVAALPGIVGASIVMPDGHWGYGFPIGGVAAFDETEGGVVSAGGVGFDIACGVRCLLTGLAASAIEAVRAPLADALYARVPAGLGSTGALRLNASRMHDMLTGGAAWAVEQGYGRAGDLERIEARGRMLHARPGQVSDRARQRQRDEMGTLGSGNHYLEVQEVVEIRDAQAAAAFGLRLGEAVVMIHCGSRGLGHQIGTDYLARMVEEAPRHGLVLPDRELACAPIASALGQSYLGAMRAAVNCALANRQILTHLVREVFAHFFPAAELPLLYDVSHNTCQVETHEIDGRRRVLHVHRKGATRAFGPGHPELPATLRPVGQPVLIGGSMGTGSFILAGSVTGETLAFSSACHGAGRAMSRHQAARTWQGRAVVDELAALGITVRSASARGLAEEAPGAYKDVAAVVEAAQTAGLARIVARTRPMVCVKG